MSALERLSEANVAVSALYEAAREAEVRIEQLEAEVEAGRARAARLAEEIWQMTGERVAIL